jgi:tRNA (uracil-5-)-methyltransferase
VLESVSSSKKGARDAVTPLANMTYIDQLEHKNQSMAQILKKLVRPISRPCTVLNTDKLWFCRNC